MDVTGIINIIDVIVFSIVVVSVIALVAFLISRSAFRATKRKMKIVDDEKDKQFNELKKRLPEIEYTEILTAFPGGTKFLVTYNSGIKETITVMDNSLLSGEYFSLLKNKNDVKEK